MSGPSDPRDADRVEWAVQSAIEELDPDYTGCHGREQLDGRHSYWAVVGMLVRDVIREATEVLPGYDPAVMAADLPPVCGQVEISTVSARRGLDLAILVQREASSLAILRALLDELGARIAKETG